MIKLRFSTREIHVLAVLIIAGGLACDTGLETETTYGRIRDYIDTIPVINTHEHQIPAASQGDDPVSFYTLLSRSYLQADIVSAGAPSLRSRDLVKSPLDDLWATYGQALNYCRGTSYYSHFLAGFRVLYGYKKPSFDQIGIQRLSKQIKVNYARREEWYAEAFKTAGFDLMFVDQYWDTLNSELDARYYALVLNISPFFSGISYRSNLIIQEGPTQGNIYKLAEEEGVSIKNLDDYLAYVDRIIQMFIENNVVCFKNSSAYGRTLDYKDVPYERAATLYLNQAAELSDSEKQELVDFMFHWIIKKSIEVDLPIQIHTGYLAGNGNTLENSHPLKLNNLFLQYPKAKFVLFHGGYPWIGEYAAMGKMFPNVYLDTVWLPQISREAAVRGLDEMFDTVPYNKFFWGGDSHFIEESTGFTRIWKGCLCTGFSGSR